jgi:xanthine dehydrogenase accessory factor
MQGSASPAEVARLVAEVLEGRRGGRAAAATVIGRSGSAPQVVGAKLLLLDDGTLVGTVGGGAIEAQVIEACRATLREGRCRRVQAHLVRDLGMCCGGSMEVFVEYLQAQTRLFVIGAGHVAQALVPMAVAADFAVTVLDDREELLEHPSFAGVRAEPYDVDELRDASLELREDDCVLIVTRDHARDEQALSALLRRPHAYLGMIGSRRKVHAVLRRVLHREQQQGRALPDLSRVHAPVGLELGGRTPGEIAVSIVAQLVARRHGGSGESMSIVSEVVSQVLRDGIVEAG